MSIIFTGPGVFEDYLTDRLYDLGDGVLIRDFYGRPWIVGFDDGGDPFVISWPAGKDENAQPKRKTYHGDLALPAYPVRIVKES